MWFLLLLLLVTASPSWAGQLDVSWTAPTTYTDGSPLSPTIVSYRVYWMLFPQTPCPGTQFIVTNTGVVTAHLGTLTQGFTYNAQVTAVVNGLESACSLMASGVARADDALPVGSGLQIVFVPSPSGTFQILGITPNQTVTGVIRVSAVPVGTISKFTFTLKNSAGTVINGNDEFATPYCYLGDSNNVCFPFDTHTVPNGQYTMEVTRTNTNNTTELQVIHFSILN